MQELDETIRVVGFTLMIATTIVLVLRHRDPWREQFETEFKRALEKRNIGYG